MSIIKIGTIALIFFALAMVSIIPSPENAEQSLSLDPDIVGLWHMDENTGEIIKDETENHNDGIIHGAQWAEGRSGSGLYFNGNAYVDLGNGASLNYLTDYTIEAWIKPSPESLERGNSNWALMICKYGIYSLDLWIWDGSLFGAFGLGHWWWAKSIDLIEPDVWTYVAFTNHFDNAQYIDIRKLYINGVDVPTVQGRGLTGWYCDPLYFGTHSHSIPPIPNDDAYVGVLDEVQITERVLSDEEILDHYNSFLVITVSIDIKPGSYPNTIKLGSEGTVPVAILSTNSFDARTVDPTTVTLASAPVKLKGKGTPMASAEDVNGDGLLDLVVHVSTEALQVSETDTEAVLEGKTSEGKAVQGKDSIRVIL